MNREDARELIERAFEVQAKAYVPYSDFKVGAAVRMKNGEIHTGCNMENASYGATICAERAAFAKAISQGNREFEAIAVVGKEGAYTFPCGICRQFIIEFGRNIQIIVAKNHEEYKIFTIDELLPYGFTREDL